MAAADFRLNDPCDDCITPPHFITLALSCIIYIEYLIQRNSVTILL